MFSRNFGLIKQWSRIYGATWCPTRHQGDHFFSYFSTFLSRPEHSALTPAKLDSLRQSLVISLSTSLHSCCFFLMFFFFFNSATVLLCKFWLTVKHCDILINTYAGKKNNCLLGIHYTLISRPAVRNKYLCLTWQIKHWSYFFINPHRQIVNIFRME